jgi:hypothetical protein
MSEKTPQSERPPSQPQVQPTGSINQSLKTQTEQPDKLDLRDVKAQEEMAFWAMWMFVAALATFAITSIGTFLIWRQVRLTRNAVEEASAGTEAMRDANAIARQVGEAQARCYLSARDVLFSVEAGGIPHVEMTVLNSGHSPARGFKWAFQVRLANIADEWIWENQPVEPTGSRDISAQQLELLSLRTYDGNPMPQGQLSDLLLEPQVRVTLVISAVWHDVFGVEHQEKWPFECMGPLGVDVSIHLFSDPSAKA